MTNREFISAVRNGLDAITLDDYIPGQYIYTIGVSFAKLFIKRESDSRKIFKNTSMFTDMGCFKLKEVNDNCGIDLPCNTMMRSVDKIPTPYLSNYGSLLLIYNVTGEKNYIETNPITYRSIKAQKFKSKTSGYFTIKDGYLYVLDSSVEQLKGLVLTSDPKTGCKILDESFPVLDYLESSVIEATIKHILTSKNIQRDENGNLSENLKQ